MDLELVTNGGYLSKLQAIILLGKGKVLSHRYFDSNEYMEEKNGYFLLSGQWKVSKRMFWLDRKNDIWDFGWFEVKLHPDGFIKSNNDMFVQKLKKLDIGDQFRVSSYARLFELIRYIQHDNGLNHISDDKFMANNGTYNYEDVIEIIDSTGKHFKKIIKA